MFTASSARYGIVVSCMALTLDATAGESLTVSPNAAMRYVAVSAQSDSAHNHEASGALSLTLGDHAWIHAGLGKTSAQQGDDSIDPILLNIGAGMIGSQLSLTLDFSSRKDGDHYDQRDWNSSLDWHNDRFALGIDGMHRDTDAQAMVPIADGQGGVVNVPIAESLRGNGWGLHTRFNATDRLTFSLAGMHYHYDTHSRQSGSVVSSGNGGLLNTLIGNALNNRPLLAQQLLLQASGITREAAILQRSWNAGVSYRLDRAALSVQYFNDKALEGDGTVNTAEFGAAIFLDKHWTLSPAVGHSHSEQLGGVTFGSVTASYGW